MKHKLSKAQKIGGSRKTDGIGVVNFSAWHVEMPEDADDFGTSENVFLQVINELRFLPDCEYLDDDWISKIENKNQEFKNDLDYRQLLRLYEQMINIHNRYNGNRTDQMLGTVLNDFGFDRLTGNFRDD